MDDSNANTDTEPTPVSLSMFGTSDDDSSSKVHLFGTELVDAKPPNTESFPRRNRNSKQKAIPIIFTGEIIPDGNDTILRETVIEIVRYRLQPSMSRESNRHKPDSSVASQSQGISMPAGSAITTDTREIANIGLAASSNTGLSNQSIVFDSSHTPSQTNNRDESLRYLLWHINGTRENVRKSSEKTA